MESGDVQDMNTRNSDSAPRTGLCILFGVVLQTVAAASFAGISLAQAPPATLHVELDKPLHAVSPTLYGLMTEEINYSYDGGLYAEMVRNRTFQEHGFGRRCPLEH